MWDSEGYENDNADKFFEILHFSGSLVHLPVEFTDEDLSQQSSLSSFGHKARQKSLPLIVEERAANTNSHHVIQVL